MDVSKYEEDIQKAINNFLQDAEALQYKITKLENLKQTTQRTLQEIQEELSKMQN